MEVSRYFLGIASNPLARRGKGDTPIYGCPRPPKLGGQKDSILYFLISILAILQGILGWLDGLRAARHIRGYRPLSDWRPRVVVFCPCKGTDAEFAANI